MLSVLHESIDIYIGQTLIIVKVGRLGARAIEIPSTLPAHMVMERLDEVVADCIYPEKRRYIFRRRLRVKFGSALCPAISFNVPDGVIRWDEKMQIAHSTAISIMGQDVEITCELAKGCIGIVAALPLARVSELKRWANERKFLITSCEPLWAAMSRTNAVTKNSVSGFIFHEPDAVSILNEDVDGRLSAATFTHAEDRAVGSLHYRRWMVGVNAQEDKMVKIRFSSEINKSALPYRRDYWMEHCEIS